MNIKYLFATNGLRLSGHLNLALAAGINCHVKAHFVYDALINFIHHKR